MTAFNDIIDNYESVTDRVLRYIKWKLMPKMSV